MDLPEFVGGHLATGFPVTDVRRCRDSEGVEELPLGEQIHGDGVLEEGEEVPAPDRLLLASRQTDAIFRVV